LDAKDLCSDREPTHTHTHTSTERIISHI